MALHSDITSKLAGRVIFEWCFKPLGDQLILLLTNYSRIEFDILDSNNDSRIIQNLKIRVF